MKNPTPAITAQLALERVIQERPPPRIVDEKQSIAVDLNLIPYPLLRHTES